MTKKNILHVTFDMAIGGTEQVIRQIVENTDIERFQSSILCIDGNIGALGQKLINNGIPISSLERKPGLDITLIRSLKSHLIEKDIHVVHCHQYTPYIYGLFAAFGTKTKVIFTEHGRFYPDTKKWKRMIINPFLSQITYAITAISAATAEALTKFENFPRKKVQVIYNGIKDISGVEYARKEVVTELQIPNTHKVVGTISRLDPIKNQMLILKSFSAILEKFPDTTLLLVGDGPLRADLEAEANNLGITQNTRFTGFKVDPQRYLQAMDIFLLPSLSEGTSMTLLESMASSKPSIVTNVGGNPEIVIDNVTGIVIPSEDSSALTRSLCELLENNSTRFELGKAARQRYLELFSVEQMISSYHSLYDNAFKQA